MTELEWFAFVILPLGISVFGALFAVLMVVIIKRGDRR